MGDEPSGVHHQLQMSKVEDIYSAVKVSGEGEELAECSFWGRLTFEGMSV